MAFFGTKTETLDTADAVLRALGSIRQRLEVATMHRRVITSAEAKQTIADCATRSPGAST